jgi:hypothetical protein
VLKPILLFSLVALTALSGCSDQGAKSDNPTSTSPQRVDGDESSPDEGNVTLAPFSNQLRLTDCQGVLSLNYLPKPLANVEPPPEWAPNDVPVTRVRIEAHLCSRVAFGPFERGPVTLILETHDNRSAPESCITTGDFLTTEILHHIWMDDDEILALLNSELGLPVSKSSPLRVVAEPGNAFAGYEIEIEGSVTRLEADQGDAPYSTIRDTYRYFWPRPNGGIGQLDLAMETLSPSSSPPTIIGEVKSPFVAAIIGSPAYSGYGEVFRNSSAEGTFTLYGDPKCNG